MDLLFFFGFGYRAGSAGLRSRQASERLSGELPADHFITDEESRAFAQGFSEGRAYWRATQWVRRYTTAPATGDVYGTRDITEDDSEFGGEPLRLVLIDPHHLLYQQELYRVTHQVLSLSEFTQGSEL